MERVAVIGCNEYGDRYRRGLELSNTLELVAAYDPNPESQEAGFFDGVPFYSDIADLLDEIQPDTALVAVGVEQRAVAVRAFLECGMNVLVEKPMAQTYQEMRELYILAEQQGVHLQCILPWSTAPEVQFLKKFLADQNILRINTELYYPDVALYDGVGDINVAGCYRIPLYEQHRCGAWLDGGADVLSMLYEIIQPFGEHVYESERMLVDEACGQDYYVVHKHCFGVDKTYVDTRICVDWRYDNREKETTITYGLFERLLVDHEGETVTRVMADNEREVLFDSRTHGREHDLIPRYLHNFRWREDERRHTLTIYRILFNEFRDLPL